MARRAAANRPARQARGGRVEVQVDGRHLRLSNLEKVLYPRAGFTKGQVIDYYTRVAQAVLPHLRDRPLTLKRYPDGVEGEHFYEKRCPSHRPEWVSTAEVSTGSETIEFCLVQDLPTLVWAANLADLELHTSLSRARAMARPTMMVFDLDPGEPAGILECAQVALWLRESLDSVGLGSCPKTSGSKGLQVYVPLNVDGVSYRDTKPLARALAEHLQREHRDAVVSTMNKSARRGKVLIDWSQNDEHKTTVCVYSLRARERPTVSTPLKWTEVQHAVRSGSPDELMFDSRQVLDRLERHGDLFADVLSLEQRLPEL